MRSLFGMSLFVLLLLASTSHAATSYPGYCDALFLDGHRLKITSTTFQNCLDRVAEEKKIYVRAPFVVAAFEGKIISLMSPEDQDLNQVCLMKLYRAELDHNFFAVFSAPSALKCKVAAHHFMVNDSTKQLSVLARYRGSVVTNLSYTSTRCQLTIPEHSYTLALSTQGACRTFAEEVLASLNPSQFDYVVRYAYGIARDPNLAYLYTKDSPRQPVPLRLCVVKRPYYSAAMLSTLLECQAYAQDFADQYGSQWAFEYDYFGKSYLTMISSSP
jgi:hypothetical protein